MCLKKSDSFLQGKLQQPLAERNKNNCQPFICDTSCNSIYETVRPGVKITQCKKKTIVTVYNEPCPEVQREHYMNL